MNKNYLFGLLFLLSISLCYAITPLEDDSGNNYNVTNIGATYNALGYYSSLGTGTMITKSFSINNSSMSVSAWSTCNSYLGSTFFLVKNDSGTAYQWGLYNANASISFYVTTKTAVVQVTATNNACGANRTVNIHYMGTFNGTKAILYINGISAGSQTVALTQINGTNAPMSLFTWTWGNNFNGSLDDVRVYNKSLSPAEVLNVYNNLTNISSLVLRYQFTNNSCVYNNTGDFVQTNSVCNITMNTTVNTGKSWIITNSTVWKRNVWVKNYSWKKVISGWLHNVGF